MRKRSSELTHRITTSRLAALTTGEITVARKAKKRKITKIKVIDLKRQKSAASLKKTLQQASKRKVAIIVLNAPFKLAA